MESNLIHATVALREGLDLFNPRLEAGPGSLLDCSNYEVVDTVGYRRIDGFERFDGTASVTAGGRYYLITWSGNSETYDLGVEEAFQPGDIVSTYSNYAFGTVLSSERFAANAWGIVVIATVSENDPSWVAVGDQEMTCSRVSPGLVTVTAYLEATSNTGVTAVTSLPIDSPLLSSEALGALTETLVGYLNDGYDELRDEKTKLPWWSARAHGLHWFKDRLYAVADCEYVYMVTNGEVVSGVLYPGEIFTFDTASFTLLDYQVLEGSLYAANAVIKALVQRRGSVLLSAEHLTDGGSTRATGNSLKLYSTAVPTLSTGVEDIPVWGAALYRTTSEEQAVAESQREGWNPIDMGLEVSFTGGTGTPIAELSREFYETPIQAATPSSIEAGGAAAFLADGTITSFVGSTAPGTSYGNDIAEDDSSYIYLTGVGAGPVSWVGGTDGIDLRGFDMSSLPEDCFVTGIEVKMLAATFRSGSAAIGNVSVKVPDMFLTGFERLSSNRGSFSTATTIKNGYATYTWGGDNDLWGIGDLVTRNQLVDAVAGIRARFLAVDDFAANDQLRIDRIWLVIHYVPATSRVYIGGASTDRVAVDVVRVHVRRDEDTVVDTWTNAEGTLHVYNITNDAGGTRSWIAAGDGIYLAATGGTAVATVVGTKGSLLPTLSEISERGTRYQMISANFYAREDWESIYGVSGVSRAFAWDDKYFRKIYTELDGTIDTPRHISYYRNYLALGYNTGNVLLSALTSDGPEPENFGGNNAQGFNFNDKVFGLATLPDTSLGVFCENSIHRLILTQDGNLNQSAIAPNAGIIEYTLAPMGYTTVFCDRRGIRSLEQVDVYGDFIGRPLSTKLGSWLRNRLTVFNPYSGAASETSPVAAYSVRNKNQYRLWFRDGTQLTMTLLGQQEEPVFTIQRFRDGTQFYVPVALSHGVDQYGRERIHFAHYAHWLGATASTNTDTDKMYVFEMDKGWHFDDNTITGYVDITYNPLENPVQEATLKKIRLYGNSTGIGTLRATTRHLYNESFSTTSVDISLPRSSDVGFPPDPRWYTNIANVSERGQHIGIRISHSPAIPEPSHTLQSLILDFTQGKLVT